MAIQRITSGIIADGAIVATDIGDGIVTNAKLAGSITFDKITSVSNTAISGLIQAAQIGSANASVIDAGTLAKARLPAGSVLQVVTATTSTPVTITSTSMTDLGLSASITPTSASSKILVLVNQNLTNYQNTSSSRNFGTQLLRGATIISNKLFYSYAGVAGNGYVELTLDGTYILLDSPATTSSTTYKTQGTVSSSADDTTLVGQAGSRTSSITLMEIAA